MKGIDNLYLKCIHINFECNIEDINLHKYQYYELLKM